MSKVHLILAFHNHQPVGNFDHVLEDCCRKAYLPFLETLLAHPGIKVVLHYSGFLLEWMMEHHPDAVEILRKLIDEGRVEMLSGGYYEPILSVLPDRDRALQVKKLSGFIKKRLGCDPRGMWLAERVWEPQMPRIISGAGIDYLPIDDYHFKLTGKKDDDLLGYYISEDEGSRVAVFPGSEKLRYFIPFRGIDEVLSYLRETSAKGENPLLTMADDGEKFGAWPNTYRHCYENGWLSNFFRALEDNQDWIETTTFSEYRKNHQPLGMVYLPTASYREMGEWTLPADSALEYESTLEELQIKMGEDAKRMLRGGIWRSFFTKYPESNHIHKRMFMVSRRVHEAASSDKSRGREAVEELWKAQCNDAYWHGIFGGLYLPHLRSALHGHLIKAEAAADSILKDTPWISRSDFDADGFDDVVVGTKNLILAASQKSGALTELSFKYCGVNVLDIFSRRPEAYHDKITKASSSTASGAATIHDQIVVKEAGLAGFLVYDEYRRTSLLDRFYASGVALDEISSGRAPDQGDFINAAYDLACSKKGRDIVVSFGRNGEAAGHPMMIEKTVLCKNSKDLIKVGYRLTGEYRGLFAVEMNLSLLGSPHSLIDVGGRASVIRSTAEHKDVREFAVEDKYIDLRLRFSFDEPVDVMHYPVETVSLSEQGIERLYQGTALLFMKKIETPGENEFSFDISYGRTSA